MHFIIGVFLSLAFEIIPCIWENWNWKASPFSRSEIQRISKDEKQYLFTKCYIHHYSSVIILRVCLKFETDRSWPGIEGEGVNFGFGQIANQFLLEIENLQCWKLSCNQVMVNLRINFNINHLFWLKVTPTEAPKKNANI